MKNQTLRFGSVCSGIEAASVAWEPLGWKAAWLSEIEPFPSAVLAHHYPDVPNLGDMTTITERIKSGEIEAPDIFCGGTPCQAFSVAGKRQSLDDDRGNLSLIFCEIANAIDDVRRNTNSNPTIIFWENVPGVLNTKDNAFGCFLSELAGEPEELQPTGAKWSNAGMVRGPKRTVAWRVLDAQYFGLAQRRKRVFVVASARDGFDPAEILFEFEGVRRDTQPSREAGKGFTHDTSPCLTASGRGVERVGDTRGQDPVVAVTKRGFRMVAFGEYADDNTASTMKARDYKDATDLVAYGMPGNGIGRKPENGGNSTQFMHEVAPAQTATDKHGVIAFNSRQDPVSGDVPGALDTGSPQAQSVVLPLNSMTMQGRPSDDLKPRMGSGIGEPGDPQNTLSAAHHHAVAVLTPPQYQVRRLTPVECERLQGFPDNYTAIPWRNKPADQCPDGPRYKSLGNSWAVPVVRWIGERIDDSLKGAA